MHETKRWTVIIDIDKRAGHTRAVARLYSRETDRFTGVGIAWLDPTQRDVPAIGDEVAMARAIGDLAVHLADHAAWNINEQPATLTGGR